MHPLSQRFNLKLFRIATIYKGRPMFDLTYSPRFSTCNKAAQLHDAWRLLLMLLLTVELFDSPPWAITPCCHSTRPSSRPSLLLLLLLQLEEGNIQTFEFARAVSPAECAGGCLSALLALICLQVPLYSLHTNYTFDACICRHLLAADMPDLPCMRLE
jgi:hypothetical protein